MEDNQVTSTPVAPEPQIMSPKSTPPAARAKEGRFAVAGLILAIAGLITMPLPFIAFPLCVLAIIFSSLSIKSPKKRIALAGLIIAGIALTINLILTILVINTSKDVLDSYSSVKDQAKELQEKAERQNQN